MFQGITVLEVVNVQRGVFVNFENNGGNGHQQHDAEQFHIKRLEQRLAHHSKFKNFFGYNA